MAGSITVAFDQLTPEQARWSTWVILAMALPSSLGAMIWWPVIVWAYLFFVALGVRRRARRSIKAQRIHPLNVFLFASLAAFDIYAVVVFTYGIIQGAYKT